MESNDWVQLLYSDDTRQALTAVAALQSQGGSHAVSSLMQRVSDAPIPLALGIIDALIELKDARAIPALVSCIRHTSEDIRGEALYGIIALSQHRAALLPDELVKTGDPTQPSRALTQIVYPEDLEAVGLLHGLLDDADPEMRIAAAHGLGSMGAINAGSKLQSLALNDPDEDVQNAAAYALGQLVDHGCIESLTALRNLALSSTSTEPLIAAIRTLSAYRPEQHLRHFEKALTHRDDRIRQLAVIGMGRARDPQMNASLIERLTDPSPHVKRLAAHALGQIGSQSSIRVLISSGRQSSSELRASIAEALKSFPHDAVDTALSATAQASDSTTRHITAYLAGKLGVTGPFSALLTDSDETVRKQATLGLADLHANGQHSVLDAAYRALKDDSWKVRVAGIETIRRIGDKEAIGKLAHLQNDPNHVVRQAIRRTLSTF